MVTIRRITPQDIVHVIDTDLKCFDVVWDRNTWAIAAENLGVEVITVRGLPVGFSVFAIDREDPQSVCLVKLAVKPAYQKRGFGSALVESVKNFAKTMGATRIYGGVPESLCRPDDKHDVSKWLTKQGFRATEIMANAGYAGYGMDGPEDGIKFVLEV